MTKGKPRVYDDVAWQKPTHGILPMMIDLLRGESVYATSVELIDGDLLTAFKSLFMHVADVQVVYFANSPDDCRANAWAAYNESQRLDFDSQRLKDRLNLIERLTKRYEPIDPVEVYSNN